MSERVNAYFKENNLDPKNPVPGMMRMVPVMGIALVCFLITNNFWAGAFPMWARVLTAIVYGWAQAMPLLHVMHDSSHTAFGHNQTWWWWGGRLFMDFFAGASMTSWHHQHVVGHHIHTNVFLADPDLPAVESGDARRLVSRQTWSSLYKYQHIYLLPLYGILGIKFRVQDFTGTFFGKENGPVRVNPLGWKLWAQLWVSKFVFLAWRIVLPLCLFDISAKEYWALVMVSEWMTGWWLAFNFQVSHVSTACEYPLGDKREPGENVDDEWAMSQVRTSVDYSHGSWWAAFMSGALNYQITHHIYPGVSQYHYPAIAPIIIQTCEEFGLKYTVLPSYWSALKAHVDHLKELGQRGEAAEVHMG
jgi:fatty acid desaturase